MASDKRVKLNCFIRRETVAAIEIEWGAGMKAWIPKTCVKINRGGGPHGACDIVTIPNWLAKNKGINNDRI